MDKPKNIKAWIKSNNIRPNKLERTIIRLIKENDLPFIYNGNKANLIIRGRIPDFYDKSGKRKVIEIFGEIFHNPNKSFFNIPYKRTKKGTIKHFRRYGYNVLIIWEKELNNSHLVLKKIKLFEGTNKFIY